MSIILSKGTVIAYSDDDFVTENVLTCQIASMDGPSESVPISEAETLCIEPTTKIPGAVTFGDLSITGYFDPNDAGVIAMQAAIRAGTASAIRIDWTSTPAKSTRVDGILNNFSVNTSTQQAVGLSIGMSVNTLEWDHTPA